MKGSGCNGKDGKKAGKRRQTDDVDVEREAELEEEKGKELGKATREHGAGGSAKLNECPLCLRLLLLSLSSA